MRRHGRVAGVMMAHPCLRLGSPRVSLTEASRTEVVQTPDHAVGTLVSVNVGRPKNITWQGKTVFTGVFKDPVTGPRRAWRRTACRVHLPDRLLPLLGAGAGPKRLRLRAVRRELHRRRTRR